MRLIYVVLPSLMTVSSVGCEFLDRFDDDDVHCTTDFVDPPNGELQTEFGDIEFNSVEVTLNHRNAGDDAGCLNAVELLFHQANKTGCTLTVAAANSLTEDGYLELTSINMRAGKDCPDYPEEIEGSYTNDDLGDSGIEVLGVATGEHLGCYEDGLVVHLKGAAIKRYAGVDTSEEHVELERSEIFVSGRMKSLGGDDECPESD